MRLISVRALSILLSLVLVATTAAICLSLTLTTSEDALDKTERSGQRGLDDAFAAAEVSISTLTSDYVAEITSNVHQFVYNILNDQVRVTETIIRHMNHSANTFSPTHGIELWDFYAARDRFRVVGSIMPEFQTATVMFITNNGVLLAFMEHQTTLGTVTNDRKYLGAFNNYTGVGNGKDSVLTLVDNNMDPLNPNFKCNRADHCSYLDTSYVWPCPNPKAGTLDCTVAIAPLDPLDPTGFVFMPSSIMPDYSSRLWASVEARDSYVGVTFLSTIHSSLMPPNSYFGTRVAMMATFVDLSAISTFLTQLTLPIGTRVFTVASYGADIGYLTGASHGNSKLTVGTNMYGGPIAAALNCTNASDTIVRGVCTWAFHRPLQFVGLSSSVTYEERVTPGSSNISLIRATSLTHPYGLFWTIFVVIPRDTVLGEIEATAARTRQIIADDKKQVDDDKAHNYMVMQVVLVVVCVCLMGASVAFTLAITRPMITLQREMADVAQMDLEAVDLERPVSALEEVGSMQVSFLRMCHNLKEYRNYLPASILAMMANGGTEREEEEDVDANDDAVTPTPKDDSAVSVSTHSRSSKSTQLTKDRRRRESSTAHSIDPLKDLIKKRRMSVVVVNVRGFHARMDQQPSETVAFHAEYVRRMVEIVRKHRGTPDVFLGDRFLATWNTVTRVATHRTSACHAAYAAVTTLPQHLASALEASTGRQQDGDGVEVTAGVASSEARAGNMGCEGMKKYTYVGPCAALAGVVERLNKRYGSHALVHGVVQEEAVNSFHVRLVDKVVLPAKFDPSDAERRPFSIYELVSARAASDQEWMYQLKDDGGDRDTKFSAAVEAYLAGDVDKATACLAAYVAACGGTDDTQTRRLAALLKAGAVKKGELMVIEDL
eukprot:PhM_4_TR18689/c1_g1_i3/m.46265/K01768/E4.6.1.1; adenylate cyclase